MRRGSIEEGRVARTDYPARGIVETEGRQVRVHGALAGQQVRFRVTKSNSSRTEGQVLEVLERAPYEVPSDCPHFEKCGGCIYRTMRPQDELDLKGGQIERLLAPVVRTGGLSAEEPGPAQDRPGAEAQVLPADGHPETGAEPAPAEEHQGAAAPGEDGHAWFEGIFQSPDITGYRNKMELSFGDMEKGGPLQLGLHARGSFYDILTVSECRIMPDDFRKIAAEVLAWARETGLPHYHKITHRGYFRHLLLRRAVYTGEILADLVTSSQAGETAAGAGARMEAGAIAGTGAAAAETVAGAENVSPAAEQPAEGAGMEAALKELQCRLLALPLDGHLVGILHTVNDSVSDTIKDEHTDVLYGNAVITEQLLGMKFRITPFSFFQTNSRGAEVLYSIVREYIGDTKDKVIFDLYSGTGTIAQILAPVAKHVTGVEIVPEAVQSARENARLNGLENCDFICGDVLKAVDELEEKPDLIVLDPPRDGIHPAAMPKIISFGVRRIVYISCKATSLRRDLEPLQRAGYCVDRISACNLFCGSEHVEVIAGLTR